MPIIILTSSSSSSSRSNICLDSFISIWIGLYQWTNGNTNSICALCKLLTTLGNFLLKQPLQGFRQSIPWVQKAECTVWVEFFNY